MTTHDRPSAAPPGLARRPSSRFGSSLSARDRSVVLCLLLLATFAVALHPEWLVHVVPGARPSDPPPLPAGLLLRNADAAGRRGDLEESSRLLAWFVSQHPEHSAVPTALLQRVRIALELGHLEDARRIYAQLKDVAPRHPELDDLLLDLATREYDAGHYEAAAASYTELIARTTHGEAEAAPAPRSRRNPRQRQRTARRSADALERLARFNLALCYEQAGNAPAALRAYERFGRRFPRDARIPEAWFRIGVLHLEAGRAQQALRRFEALRALDPVPAELAPPTLYFTARCLEELGRVDAAEATYAAAQAIAPADDPYRLAALGRLAARLETREPLRAAELYEDLARSSPDPVRRAICRQNVVALQEAATVASAAD